MHGRLKNESDKYIGARCNVCQMENTLGTEKRVKLYTVQWWYYHLRLCSKNMELLILSTLAHVAFLHDCRCSNLALSKIVVAIHPSGSKLHKLLQYYAQLNQCMYEVCQEIL